mgnify:CR=1 FL=1
MMISSVEPAADPADLSLCAGKHVDLPQLGERLWEEPAEVVSVGEPVDHPACGAIVVEVLVDHERAAAALQHLVEAVVQLGRAGPVV